MKKRSEKIRV